MQFADVACALKTQTAIAGFGVEPRLRSNESPSGAFKRQSGLAQQDGGALPRQALPQQDHLENSQEFEK